MSTPVEKVPGACSSDERQQLSDAVAEAMHRIASIASDDETAVITDRSITFLNRVERTTISAEPVNIDTWDGHRISACITIRTPLTTFKMFDEKNYSFQNLFATTGAIVRDADGQDAVVSRLPLFEGDDRALEDLYTPLIANAALLQLVGPWCGLDLPKIRRGERGPADLGLPGWDEPTRWDAWEFEYAKEQLENRGAYANAGPAGLTAEFAWETGAVSAVLGHRTSLLQIHADQPHPLAGNGLFHRLDLPLELSHEEAQAWAARLNRIEAEGIDTPPFFGAWTTLPDSHTLSFAGFWPNLMYMQGTVANIAIWSAARSWMARSVIANRV